MFKWWRNILIILILFFYILISKANKQIESKTCQSYSIDLIDSIMAQQIPELIGFRQSRGVKSIHRPFQP